MHVAGLPGDCTSAHVLSQSQPCDACWETARRACPQLAARHQAARPEPGPGGWIDGVAPVPTSQPHLAAHHRAARPKPGAGSRVGGDAACVPLLRRATGRRAQSVGGRAAGGAGEGGRGRGPAAAGGGGGGGHARGARAAVRRAQGPYARAEEAGGAPGAARSGPCSSSCCSALCHARGPASERMGMPFENGQALPRDAALGSARCCCRARAALRIKPRGAARAAGQPAGHTLRAAARRVMRALN